jgi:arylsulfatase A-like enzyme
VRPLQARFLAGVVALCACVSDGGPAPPALGPPSRDRPNLVLVLLDDADVDLTESMPRLRSLMLETGTRFTSNVANTPLCGPARALLLAGQYAHNTKVYYNDGADGGYEAWNRGGYEGRDIGSRLQAQGYRTGLFGKYINDFPKGRKEDFVPKGWDDFRGVLSDREAHNNRFTLNENGTLRLYEARTGGYQTDLLARRLNEFVRAGGSKGHEPFFGLLAVSAPHVPPEPAERHKDAFPGEKAPRKPSYDEADLSDKPRMLRDQATPLTPAIGRDIDATYREMKQSLLAVEDAMEELLKTLAQTGALSNTYIILTSDNGWMRGEHRIPAEKYAPYEESIRVPLVVRGPGVPAGVSVNRVAGLVDLAPTLLELAGAPRAALDAGDGRSLLPLLHAADPAKVPWRESILIEHFGGGAPFRVRSYAGIRSEKDVYIEYVSGEREYYDLARDPYEMENRAASLPPALLSKLSARVAALKTCAASSCRAAEGAAPKP